MLSIKSLFCFWVISLSTLSFCYAQDYDKLNKNQLKVQLLLIGSKEDSLNDVINTLTESNLKLINTSSTYVAEISSFKHSLTINQLEIEKLKVSKDSIEKLLKIYERRINEVGENSKNSINESLDNISDSTDFLNKYYFDQYPLKNNSFKLALTKILVNDIFPELIDKNSFSIWACKPGIDKVQNEMNDINWPKILVKKDLDFFDNKLPIIEIIKNKLFTIKYPDGVEESLLYNVNVDTSSNNNRNVLIMKLANEDINNSEKDIVWNIFAIDNECYLALDFNQLSRIKVNISNTQYGVRLFDKDSKDSGLAESYENWPFNWVTIEDYVYIFRNIDKYTLNSSEVNSRSTIFLFKLKLI